MKHKILTAGMAVAAIGMLAGPAGAAPNRTPDAYYDVDGNGGYDRGTDEAVKLTQLAPGVLVFNQPSAGRSVGAELVVTRVKASTYAAVIAPTGDVRVTGSASVGRGLLSIHAVEGDLTIEPGAKLRAGDMGIVLSGKNVVIGDGATITTSGPTLRVDGDTITVGPNVKIRQNTPPGATPDYKTGTISLIAKIRVTIDESAEIGGRNSSVTIRP